MNTNQTLSPESLANMPGVAELAEWVKSLAGREAITAETVGREIERRFHSVPGSVTGEAMVGYGVARLGGTYDEFRAEAGAA